MSERPQLQNTSQIDTELPVKGMTKDPNTSLVGKDAWTHCRNCINNSQKGDVGSIGNEPANFQCACSHYPIIGTIHLYGDKWIIYSTDDTNSEIGLFDDSRCEYTTLVNDACLSFDRRYLITGASKENFDCSWQVYWDDGLNPSRTLNLGFADSIPENRNIPWKQIITSPEGAACVIYEDAQPLRLDCERIRLAPLLDIPCMDLQKSKKGGQLRNGSYQAFIAYTLNEQKIGDYISFSNIQPLFDHEDGSCALTLEISNLDKEFEFFELVISSNNQGQMQAKKLGFYSTENKRIEISYIDQKLETVPIEFLPLRTPAYEKSDKMYVVNDYLIRQGPTTQFDFNYQPFANEIVAHWVSMRYPANYYQNGGNKTTFMRDEQYAFFIRFVYTTGEKSQSYHIPGRPPHTAADPNPIYGDELALGDANNSVNTGDLQWQVENTAYQNDLLPGYTVGTTLNDGGFIAGKGYMGYWESTERYPAIRPDIWNSPNGVNLCGEHIRHHKMPDEQTCSVTHRSTGDAQSIYLLAVEFENIVWPQDNQGQLIPNIAGFEILVGSREGHKSIVAKGIMRNMQVYTVPGGGFQEQDSDGQGDMTGLFPNYPFNDLRTDNYLVAEEYAEQSPKNDDGGTPLSSYKFDTFTFHSPETSFNRPFLNPRYVQSYGVTTGNSVGRFYASEKHPGQKLLRNIAAIIAAIIGAGYALGEMRGGKKRKQKSGGSLSIGRNIGPYANTDTKNEMNPSGTVVENVATPWSTFVGTGGGGAGTVTTDYDLTSTYSETDEGSENDVEVAEVDYDGNSVIGGGAAPSQQDQAVENAEANVDSHQDASADNTPGDVGAEAQQDTPQATQLPTGLNSFDDNPETAAIGANFPFNVTESSNTAEQKYFKSMNKAHNKAKKKTSGHTGPSEEIEMEHTRTKALPNIIQIASKIYTFLNYMSSGGQEIIDLIYNLSSYRQYALKYSAHGLYLNTASRGNNWKKTIERARYLGDSFQNLDQDHKINNLHRPKTVVVKTDENLTSSSAIFQDTSKFTLSSAGGSVYDKSANQLVSNISAHYVGLKLDFSNQYGQLDGIRQIPAPACYIDFKQDLIKRGLVSDNGEFLVNQQTTFNSRLAFGGDAYLSRYTEKVIMPFFWEFLYEQPDGFPFDYRLRVNVPYPRYWANFENYDMSAFVSPITDLTFSWADDGIPSKMRNLDGGTMSGVEESIDVSSVMGGVQGPDTQGSSLFVIGNQFFYTHCNGINDFFVESEINTALRDWEDVDGKTHYEWTEYTDVTALFDAKIIRDGNYYKYDLSLSKNKFFSALISFGTIQPRDYDPEVAEKCYIHYPKRLIYSNRAEKESKKDFWKVFLPNNYKDFKNKVNVIKPTSKSGALVLFPHLAPQMFQGVDQLTTDLKTKLTIGDGGLFSNPMQNITNADLPHEYGSCESARSVINTPSGLFYISQAQGKVFTYTGQGISNIANYGMKHWFNKYLPSVLLHYFPELEGTVDVDNPVVGIGCQSVYDPNYDLVYFCKKDYEPIPNECIEYDPELGFVYNATICDGEVPVATCPPGYELINGQCIQTIEFLANTSQSPSYSYLEVTQEVPQYSDPICPEGATYNPDTGLCEEITTGCPPGSVLNDATGECEVTTPGDDTCDLDVMFVVDASSSVWMNGNASRMKNFVRNYLEINQTAINDGKIKIGFVSFSFFAHMGPQGCSFPDGDCDCRKADQFNGPLTLSSDYGDYGSGTGMEGWIKNYYRAMGKEDANSDHCPCLHCTTNTTPPESLSVFDSDGNPYTWDNISGNTNLFGAGNCNAYDDGWTGGNTDQYAGRCTNLIDGLWHGLNMLYADGSRDGVDKRLILLYDGVQNLVPWNWNGVGGGVFNNTGDRTAGTFADNVNGNWYNSNPPTPTYAFQDGPRDADNYYTNSNPITGVENYDGTLTGGAAVTGNYVYMSPNWVNDNPSGSQMAGGGSTYTAFGPGGFDVWDQGFMQPSGQQMGFAATSGWFDWWTTNVTQNPEYVDSTNSKFRGRLQVTPIFMWNNSLGLSGIDESVFAGIEAYGRNLAGIAINPETNQLQVDGSGEYVYNYHTHLNFFSDTEVENISSIVANNSGCSSDPLTTIVDLEETTVTSTPDYTVTWVTETIPDTYTTEITYETITEDCPSECETIASPTGTPTCRCVDIVDPTQGDALIPVSLDDPEYFKDISWTVSYDPKAQAWISFHDWHPELTLPSLNHFFTTKTIEDRDLEPYCPPGYSYDEDTDECCQTLEGNYPGIQNLQEVAADVVPQEGVVQTCPTDIHITIDTSGSMNGNGRCLAANTFVYTLANALDMKMDGSISGDTANAENAVQVGITVYSDLSQDCGNGGNNSGNYNIAANTFGLNYSQFDNASNFALARVPMTNSSAEILATTLDINTPNDPSGNYGQDITGSLTQSDGYVVGVRVGSGDSLNAAMVSATGPFADLSWTPLGDRSSQPGYQKHAVILSDANPAGANAEGGCGSGNNGSGDQNCHTQWAQDIMIDFWNDGGISHAFVVRPGFTNDDTDPWWGIISCMVQGAGGAMNGSYTGIYPAIMGSGGGTDFAESAEALADRECELPVPDICECPDGYELVYSTDNGATYTSPTSTIATGNPCRGSKDVICRKIDCYCDESIANLGNMNFWSTGDCDNIYDVDRPDYTNPDPLWCYYEGEACTQASYTCGGLWKHNARCDLFADYYKTAYPWEIEFVSSKGQSVEVLRSVEYQLEVYEYLYNPNIDTAQIDTGLPSDTRCEDRYHVKDYNFNEAVIYNSEQISGLLNLNLETLATLTEYPAYNAITNSFDIAFSKVEQKYRFNQFWDITDDRNIVRSQWITDMDGYDRELNLTNLDYGKLNEEHKKFRHYANKVLLRRAPVIDYIEQTDDGIVEYYVPEDKKMILKLTNTKLNTSFR
jgi:hypothetical protein